MLFYPDAVWFLRLFTLATGFWLRLLGARRRRLRSGEVTLAYTVAGRTASPGSCSTAWARWAPAGRR